ncbi:MAG: PKD domain-containing protein, partial [Candidatus Nitrotoga sp.]
MSTLNFAQCDSRNEQLILSATQPTYKIFVQGANTVSSKILWRARFALFLAVFSLAACSSGESTVSGEPTVTVVSGKSTSGATSYTISASAGANGTITPAGITTVNQGASQTYSITPASGYQIASLTVNGVSAPISSVYTFMNVQANHTILATVSPIPVGGQPITLSLLPSRTSGVAPLSVFFDTSGTTDPSMTSRPFHDLEYTWNFGDTTAGTWANGTQPGVSSKNTATGPVAAHVFEIPGTYTVTVTAYDGINTATTNKTITVQDPNTVFVGTNTICVAQLTTPVAGVNGCPSGALTVMQSSFPAAVNTYALTGKRVLFKRGD